MKVSSCVLNRAKVAVQDEKKKYCIYFQTAQNAWDPSHLSSYSIHIHLNTFKKL